MLYPGDLYVQRGQEDYENQRGQGITKYPGDPKRLRRFKRIRGSEDLKESGGPEGYWRIRGIQGDPWNTRWSGGSGGCWRTRGILRDPGILEDQGDPSRSGEFKWIRGI